VLVNYYPCFTPFLTDGTQDGWSFNGVNGWEGVAVWQVVVMAKQKLKEDASLAMNRVEQFRRRIKALASKNDAGSSERIKDVTEIDRSPWWFQ
jgi:hypothetical protein